MIALRRASVVAFSFAGVGIGASTFIRTWQDLDFVQLVQLPMFLFSTTFYPLSTYPRWLQLVVECTPLYHGVSLMRSLTLGQLSAAVVVDIAYLVASPLERASSAHATAWSRSSVSRSR